MVFIAAAHSTHCFVQSLSLRSSSGRAHRQMGRVRGWPGGGSGGGRCGCDSSPSGAGKASIGGCGCSPGAGGGGGGGGTLLPDGVTIHVSGGGGASGGSGSFSGGCSGGGLGSPGGRLQRRLLGGGSPGGGCSPGGGGSPGGSAIPFTWRRSTGCCILIHGLRPLARWTPGSSASTGNKCGGGY